ncbi:MAG TPA: hypothetical protein PKU93_03375 [Candidatus Pacearchaeota archaeon]|mgnify:CR=1 FL=1|nr:hypothetical protein [Candidatus Pacearchaeota archaeon]
MKIYPTITTLIDYKGKIEEIKALKLEKVCVFFTGLNKEERKELMNEIKKTPIKEIPFCHIRDDMEEQELDFLVRNYNTQVFNIHSLKDCFNNYDYPNYREKVCIENSLHALDEEEIKNWGGICLDLSHLENDRLTDEESFKQNLKMINEYEVQCNHISAVKDKIYTNKEGLKRYDAHDANELNDFNYLKQYDKKLFSNFCAMEINNDIAFQLKAIDHINKILNE